jgi:protein O-mannosyl-transferase
VGTVCAYTLYLGTLTTERCKDWYDTASLWRDEIEKQPIAPNAWNNLGFHYFNRFNESVDDAERRMCYDSSYYLLTTAIALDKKFVNPLVSLGELQRGAGKYQEAKVYYYKALTMKDKEGNANAWLGLAITYAITRNLDSSGICFRNAIAVKPYFPEVHSNYGNYFDMKGITDSALVHYGIAISQNPDMYAPWLNRGRLYQRIKRCDEAMRDFEKALSLNPDMGEIYYSRSYCHTASGNKAAALQDVEHALQLGFKRIDPAYYQMLKGGR